MAAQISMLDGLGGPMLDITRPEHEVEILVSKASNGLAVLHINIDGICRLRACQIQNNIPFKFNKHQSIKLIKVQDA